MARLPLDFTPFAALQRQIDANHRPLPMYTTCDKCGCSFPYAANNYDTMPALCPACETV